MKNQKCEDVCCNITINNNLFSFKYIIESYYMDVLDCNIWSNTIRKLLELYTHINMDLLFINLNKLLNCEVFVSISF